MLLLMYNFNHMSMNEFVKIRQETNKLLDVELMEIDDIKQEAKTLWH